MTEDTNTKAKYVSKYKGVLAHPSDKDTLNNWRSRVEGLSEAQLVSAVLEVFSANVNQDEFMERLKTLAKPVKVKAEKSLKAAKKAVVKAPKKVAKTKKEKAIKPVSNKQPASTIENPHTRVIEDNDEPPITVSIG